MISIMDLPGTGWSFSAVLPQKSATSCRCCGFATIRMPGKRVNNPPTQRQPSALHSPVIDNGPAPGLQKLFVRSHKLCNVLFLNTACVEWLYPWNQKTSIDSDRPIIRAASMISCSGHPVISAALEGGESSASSLRSLRPEAYSSTFSSLTYPSFNKTWAMALFNATSVPGLI